MTNAHLKMDGLAKSYGSFIAVEEFSLDIAQGEFIAIMGPSGCGKTTTLRMLAGLETADRGQITLAGNRIDQLPVWERETPMVWQSLALFPFMTVRENVEFGLKMRGVAGAERRRRADDWLERLGISTYADRNVARLSGGQRQQVAVGRALMTQPKLLMLDEPTAGVSPIVMDELFDRIIEVARTGIAILMVEQNARQALNIADRGYVLVQGRNAWTDTGEALLANPEVRRTFLGG